LASIAKNKFMAGAITLFIIISLSALITKVAALMLEHTGLSSASAKFQARSAYTGAGFTTDESEKIVNHPLRRKIISYLMLIGNAGIITAMSSLILTFVLPDNWASRLYGLLIVIGGVVLLFYMIRSKWLDTWLSGIINRALKKYTDLDVQDYASVLRISGDYQITEYKVDDESRLLNQSLIDLELHRYGIQVLGIERKNGDYIGTPNGNTVITEGDSLTLYGKREMFKNLQDEYGDGRIRKRKKKKTKS
jgi:hypothetical protein